MNLAVFKAESDRGKVAELVGAECEALIYRRVCLRAYVCVRAWQGAGGRRQASGSSESARSCCNFAMQGIAFSSQSGLQSYRIH